MAGTPDRTRFIPTQPGPDYLRSPFSTPSPDNVGGNGHVVVDGKSLRYTIPLSEALRREREQYYITLPDGTQGLDLQHAHIQGVKTFGERALAGSLRVRAQIRNRRSPEMELIQEMSLQQMVEHVKEHRGTYYKEGTTEFLLPRDYPTTTFKNKEGQWGEALFYHDTRLTLEGIMASEMPDKVEYSKGVIENFVYLIHLLGYIPNGSSLELASRSQIPTFPLMAWRVYDAMQEAATTDQERAENREWFRTVIDAVKIEYTNYWRNEEKYNHSVPGSKLIRPGDTDVGYHDIAECEQSEDMTWEAYGRSNDFQFPRMNAALAASAEAIARAEYHFAEHAENANEAQMLRREAEDWIIERDQIVTEIHKKMWDGQNFRAIDVKYDDDMSDVITTGPYMMMYTKYATNEQAESLAAQLPRFLMPFGLSNVDIETVPELTDEDRQVIFRQFHRGLARTIQDNVFKDRQWGDKKNPNDFPIKTYETIVGLTNYGFYDQAIAVAETWLLGYTKFFQDNGCKTLPEKLNALTGEKGEGGFYEGQEGFGWSIGNYLWLLKELPRLYELRAQNTHQ